MEDESVVESVEFTIQDDSGLYSNDTATGGGFAVESEHRNIGTAGYQQHVEANRTWPKGWGEPMTSVFISSDISHQCHTCITDHKVVFNAEVAR